MHMGAVNKGAASFDREQAALSPSDLSLLTCRADQAWMCVEVLAGGGNAAGVDGCYETGGDMEQLLEVEGRVVVLFRARQQRGLLD